MFLDDCSAVFGRRPAGKIEAARVRLRWITNWPRPNENAAEASPGGVPLVRSVEEAYFFLPAGFFAFDLDVDLATFAVFFFAAIVSTSPDIGMINSLRRFSKL